MCVCVCVCVCVYKTLHYSNRYLEYSLVVQNTLLSS